MRLSKLKRKIALFLSALMVFSLCGNLIPQNVKAAEQINFVVSADKTELHRGDTVVYTVDMPENNLIAGLNLKFTYDENMLELVSAEKGVVFQCNGISDLNDTLAGKINTSIVANKILKSGNVFTATFKVKDAVKGKVSTGLVVDEALDDSLEINDVTSQCSVVDNTSNVKVVVPATGISLDKNTLELTKNSTGKLTATVTPADADETVTWKSSNNNVATVGDDGTVTATGKGTADITAKVGKYTATCKVTVTVPLNGISINGTANKIKKGKTTQLTVVYDPEDTTDDKTVTWSVDDKTVAKVDKNGLVTGLKEGTAVVTAKVGTKSAAYNVDVEEVKLTSISIPDTLTIHRGESNKLTVTYNPEDTTDDKTVTWKSSDPDSVAVGTDGTITAKTVGGAVITAQVGSCTAECTAECTVTVDSPLKKIVPDEKTIEMTKNQTAVITYTFNPSDTTDSRDVTFQSSKEDVVSVDAAGKLVAKKAGTATVTITGYNGINATVTVKVKEIPINKITLNVKNVVLEAGEEENLEAAIAPANNTDDNQKITWSSSDDKVATVTADPTDSKKAVVKAVAGGTATITATAWNGTKTTCTIKVPKHITDISLSDVTVERGKTTVLNAKVNPQDTDDDTTVTWTSSNEEVATVDAVTGMIVAKKEGTTKITATTRTINSATGQPYTANATVTVKENHMTEDIAETVAFNGADEVLKGQSMNLFDMLNLQDILNKNNITDDITISWKSSDETIAVIENANNIKRASAGSNLNESMEIRFLKAGTVDVTATIQATDGAGNTEVYTVSKTLTVKEIPLDSIAFDKVITEMQVGTTEVLSVLYNPETTTDNKTVVWKSSDDKVIAVEDGVLTAKAAGAATITATVGDKTASCTITVKEADKGTGTTPTTTPDTGVTNPTGTTSAANVAAGAATTLKTGDNNHVMTYMILMVCAVALLVVSVGKMNSLKKKYKF